MTTQLHYLINSVMCWMIVIGGIAGYFITMKRNQQKWLFWIVLATGWGFLAIPNTMLASGLELQTSFVIAIWLSSYVLVFASLVLLFIKTIKILERKK